MEGLGPLSSSEHPDAPRRVSTLIRRLVFATLVAFTGTIASLATTASPAQACSQAVAHPLEYTGCMTFEAVDAGAELVVNTANPVLGRVPAPEGWQQRHLCVWSTQANRELCLFFPFPN